MTAHVVIDLGYGDSGKGTTVDALTRRYGAKLVVRDGGCQAAHHVVTPDGRAHTFAQFGSGTFAGAKTLLSSRMLVNPLNLAAEHSALLNEGATPDITIDHAAVVVTPLFVELNRAYERARGANRHGSCGQGIGETRRFKFAHPDATLRVKDLFNPDWTAAKLAFQAAYVNSAAARADLALDLSHLRLDDLTDGYRKFAHDYEIVDCRTVIGQALNDGDVIFEGSQGVMLDERHGLEPHRTWLDCTGTYPRNMIGGGDQVWWGVTRAFATRHGAGPLPTEDVELTAAYSETSNPTNDWQGPLRLGWLDGVQLRYAQDHVANQAQPRIDRLVVTHVDTAVRMAEQLGRWHAADEAFFGAPWETDRRTLFDVDPNDTSWIRTRFGLEALRPALGMVSRGETADDKEWFVP